ncbi:conjugal transfer protein TraB [Vibrio parahaemolyticus]|nr:TrbI/VirB10 family protein [Vibrio parahaemolyticus]MCR9653187.1 conjugal transfer protein TraB [Vibrio parahaemolyticus]HAS6087881.1 conjugal transfer protein TraB [Vibrio vulnificus]
MLDKLRNTFFKDSNADFEQGDEVNKQTQSRNKNITWFAAIVFLIAGFAVYKATRPPQKPVTTASNPVEFGVIVEPDFTEKDNQSALSMQQNTISELKKTLSSMQDKFSKLEQQTARDIDKAKEDTARLVEQKVREKYSESERRLKDQIKALEQQNSSLTSASSTTTVNTVNQPSTFGERKLPPRATSQSTDNPNIHEMQYQDSDQTAFTQDAFDSFDFFWETNDNEKNRRTIDNYVPTGTFVTSIVTGGADTNAGVLGQGDTTPVVFQTVNRGILPNGEKSHLDNCTITGSAYGEVSSSRGIVRTNRMSCIQENGDILDLPVRGTAFNFGRNGIRGTTILKNGKIVQMAGISGILTGLGETGKALSQTTSTSALGSTQTINGGDAALNLLGNATASVGSKLADYYIKLAEMYHPIVEINPGAMVNIVFLEGFPLDPLKAEEYERQLNAQEAVVSESNQLLDIITNTPINPLSNELNGKGITVPPTPFGIKQ